MDKPQQVQEQEDARQKALAFLQNNPIGVLSTLNKHNHPQSAAVAFIVDDHFRFYFFTRTNTAKYENIQACEHGALCIVNMDDMLTVQAEGSLMINTSPEYAGEMVTKLTGIVGDPLLGHWPPPVSKIHDGSMALVAFTPNKLRLADFRERKDDNAGYFTDIL